MIKRKDEGSYHGDDIYASIVGTDDQTASYIANFWATSVFHIKIENDTNTIDPYVIKARGDGANFSVRYYDALEGGNDITSEITGSGWTTGSLLPYGDFTEIRLEVSGNNSSDSLFQAVIAAASTGNPGRVDTVKALVILADGQPDGLVKTVDDERYYGDNIYNSSGLGQYRRWNVPAGQTAVYHIKIENDYYDADQNPDVIRVKGDAGNAEWLVKYFDALKDGSDITSEVTGSGWSTGLMGTLDSKQIRVEVQPDASLPDGDSLILSIAAHSTNDPDRQDVVMVETTVGKEGPGVKEDLVRLPMDYSLEAKSISSEGTTIRYSLPRESNVTLVLYDASGRVVKTLASGTLNAGTYEVELTPAGTRLPSGVYFCRFDAGTVCKTKKVILLR
jgi:hypothetical protein